MKRKRDFHQLLIQFNPDAKPRRRRGRGAYEITPSSRLPSWEELLAIDAAAEHAARLTRIALDASKPVDVSSQSSRGVDALDGDVGDAGQAPP